MMGRLAILLAPLVVAACAQPGGAPGFSGAASRVAGQRVGFVAEAVCLNNRSRAAQTRAAVALDFPVRQSDGGADIFINPGTLTVLRLGPVPSQGITVDGARTAIPGGQGCSVGSPAVSTREANAIAGTILAPRLVDGSDTLTAPIGAGLNESGGAGFFFRNLAVTTPGARTTFTNDDTGEAIAFDHPVILIVHY